MRSVCPGPQLPYRVAPQYITQMTGVAAQICGDRRAVKSLGYHVDADGLIYGGPPLPPFIVRRSKSVVIESIDRRRLKSHFLANARTVSAIQKMFQATMRMPARASFTGSTNGS